MTGRHNLMNALAASAVATALKVKPELIANALRSAKPPRMRGEVIDFAAGFTVVDDSYNSNPRSLLSMVHTLAEASENVKRRVVIAGEMLELDCMSARCTGKRAAKSPGWASMFCGVVRGLAAEMVTAASEEGMKTTRFFESSETAATAALDEVSAGDLILVKGSRSVETDKIVAALKGEVPACGR